MSVKEWTKRNKNYFLYCLCEHLASSFYWESIEWGNKKKHCFAWDRCELTFEKGLCAHLGRRLDLSRLEGPRGGRFCSDQCTSLIGWLCECLGIWHSHYCLSGVAEVSMIKVATVGVGTANWSDFHLDHVELDNDLSSDHDGLNFKRSSIFSNFINIKDLVQCYGDKGPHSGQYWVTSQQVPLTAREISILRTNLTDYIKKRFLLII